MNKLVKFLFGAVAIFVVVISVVIAALFYSTSGMVDTADEFFNAIKLKDITKARNYLADDFKASMDESALTDFLSKGAILNVKESSWSSRQVTGTQGELNGLITNDSGGVVPITMMLVKENGFWKIIAIQEEEMSEVCSIPENLINLVTRQDANTTAASANSTYSPNYPAWKAFDGDGASTWTQWISGKVFGPAAGSAELSYTFDTPTQVEAYSLRGRYDRLRDRLPRAWLLQGSKDDTNWLTLDKQSQVEIGDEWDSRNKVADLTFGICEPASYTQYRLVFTEVNGSSVVDLIEVELLGASPTPTLRKHWEGAKLN